MQCSSYAHHAVFLLIYVSTYRHRTPPSKFINTNLKNAVHGYSIIKDHGRFLPDRVVGGTVGPDVVVEVEGVLVVLGEPAKCSARLASEPEFERCTMNSQQHNALTR